MLKKSKLIHNTKVYRLADYSVTYQHHRTIEAEQNWAIVPGDRLFGSAAPKIQPRYSFNWGNNDRSRNSASPCDTSWQEADCQAGERELGV